MKIEIVEFDVAYNENKSVTEYFLDVVKERCRKNISVHATKESAERAKRRWVKENGE